MNKILACLGIALIIIALFLFGMFMTEKKSITSATISNDKITNLDQKAEASNCEQLQTKIKSLVNKEQLTFQEESTLKDLTKQFLEQCS